MTERELFHDAVMQYMVDDARIAKESKRRKPHPIARRILFAAACILVALGVTVFSIPSARAAVETWLDDWFSAQGYLGQDAAERTKEPTIDAIITDAGENRAKVTAVAAGSETYAAAFDMTLDEIAYDGEIIYLTGTMSGATARPFVQPFTGGDTYRYAKNDGSLGGDPNAEFYFFECESIFSLTTEDGGTYIGSIVPTLSDDMTQTLNEGAKADFDPVFEDGKLITTNAVADRLWDAYLAEHNVRFTAELRQVHIDMQPLTGLVKGDLTLRLIYGNVEGVDADPVLSARFDPITIDANAYLTQTKTTQAQEGTRVELGGVHPVTILESQPEEERTSDDAEHYIYTRELDFTGASVSLKEISFTPTDTKIVLHVVLPESWTSAERCYAGLTFLMLLDDETPENTTKAVFSVEGPRGTGDRTGEALEYDCAFWGSTIPPSQWAKAKTLTIIPTTVYWWDMQAHYDDGPYEQISLRDGYVFTGIANHTGFTMDELYDEMTQYAMTIQLDDYR